MKIFFTSLLLIQTLCALSQDTRFNSNGQVSTITATSEERQIAFFDTNNTRIFSDTITLWDENILPGDVTEWQKVRQKVPQTRTINYKPLSADIMLNKTDIGLANVDNTSDANKPVSTAVQSALNGKAAIVHTHALSDLTQSGATTGQVPKWNGTAWVPSADAGGSVSYGAPSFNNAITSGTAFQPRSGGACNILVSGSLTGALVGVYGTSVISMSATQTGTYTNVGPGVSFFLNVLAAGDNRESATICVPAGWWVKVTNTAVGLGGSITSTYTRWDINN